MSRTILSIALASGLAATLFASAASANTGTIRFEGRLTNATCEVLGGSEAFWKFHDAAFEGQKSLNDENFEKWAAASGVDAAKFQAAMDGANG